MAASDRKRATRPEERLAPWPRATEKGIGRQKVSKKIEIRAKPLRSLSHAERGWNNKIARREEAADTPYVCCFEGHAGDTRDRRKSQFSEMGKKGVT